MIKVNTCTFYWLLNIYWTYTVSKDIRYKNYLYVLFKQTAWKKLKVEYTTYIILTTTKPSTRYNILVHTKQIHFIVKIKITNMFLWFYYSDFIYDYFAFHLNNLKSH